MGAPYGTNSRQTSASTRPQWARWPRRGSRSRPPASGDGGSESEGSEGAVRKRYDELLEKIRRAEQADPLLPPDELERIQDEAEQARQELANRLDLSRIGGTDHNPVRAILRYLGLTRSELVALALPTATPQERAAAEQAILEAEVGVAANVPAAVVQVLARLAGPGVDPGVMTDQLQRRYAAWRHGFTSTVASTFLLE